MQGLGKAVSRAEHGSQRMSFGQPPDRCVVEVDGEQHDLRQREDAVRDQFLLERGIITVRVRSIDCFMDPRAVGEMIRAKCDELATGKG